MVKKKLITAFTTGALMLALLTPLTNAVGLTSNTTANVTTTSTAVSNQTGVNVLGNTVNTSTNLTTQLGL